MQSAKKLQDQLYRIDHFLGKETVQNIMVFGFANVLFEPWNRNCVDHVQITVAEKDRACTEDSREKPSWTRNRWRS